MIGILDSGLGGLTVVNAVRKQLPGYDIIYFGDTARTPYGSKSAETIARYTLEGADFLVDRGATVLVVACSTASSAGIDQLKKKYNLPVFEVITPAVESALARTVKGYIGIIGTRATVDSGIYQQMILKKMPHANVYSAPCPLIVPLIEEGWTKRPETRMIIKKYLLPLKTRQIDTLILGCSHYPLLKDIIQQKAGRKVNVIDTSSTLASEIKNSLDPHTEIGKELTKNSHIRFFVSDITEQCHRIAEFILRRKVRLEPAGQELTP